MRIVHADDYGINLAQSERILACRRDGALNSVSILANGQEPERCIGLLDEGILKGVHINLVEGRCCAEKEKLPLLVDEEGYFNRGFIGLLCLSLVKGRQVREQAGRECLAQLERVCPLLGEDCPLRVDSHVHYHMIPAVFQGLLDACEASGRRLEHLRMPIEPLGPFLRRREVWRSIPAVNLAKTAILHLLGAVDREILKRRGVQLRHPVFFGVNLTGRMTQREVLSLLPAFEEYAEKRGEDLEILFHPGGVREGGSLLDGRNRETAAFYCSEYRDLEAETIRSLGRERT